MAAYFLDIHVPYVCMYICSYIWYAASKGPFVRARVIRERVLSALRRRHVMRRA